MNDAKISPLIAQLFHRRKSVLSKEFQSVGLPYPATYLKVTRLIESNQPCTAQTLVQQLQRDKAQITRLLNDMEKAGLITRKPNPEDRRSQLLSLSQKGEEDFATMRNIEKQVVNKMMQGISQKETDTIITLLNRLNENLQ